MKHPRCSKFQEAVIAVFNDDELPTYETFTDEETHEEIEEV